MVTKTKTDNPYLLVNKASADYHEQSYGKAIAKLYQAKKILPRMTEINNNLGIINNQIKLKQPNMFFYNYMSLAEALLLTIVLNLMFLLGRKFIKNSYIKILISAAFVLSVINLTLIAKEQIWKKYAVVSSVSTQVYSGDNASYPELFELTDGQIIEVTREEKGWSQIKYADELGWIRNEYIIKID